MPRSVEEHAAVVAALITARPAVTVPTAQAHGLVLAAAVTAPRALPVFDNSAMDGFAVRAADVAGASDGTPVRLPVTEDIPAGRTDVPTLAPGTAHRIMTGAPVPVGADAIVPVEATDARFGTDAGGSSPTVAIHRAAAAGAHVRTAGSDVQAGETVLPAGRVVTPAAVGLAAALGVERLTVVPRQRVLVVSTGTELAAPGAALLPGQIYESNAPMLVAAVRDAGAEALDPVSVGDDVEAFTALLDSHVGKVDVVLTTGGVSAGAYEVVKDALAARGVVFAKVAMQPGMPQGAGRLGGEDTVETAIVTLPGNPVSALVSFEVFVRPALRVAMGLADVERPRREATLTEALTSPPGKRQFRRGVYDADSGTVASCGPPGSHHLRWLAVANCLIEIAEDVTEVAAGARVTVRDLT